MIFKNFQEEYEERGPYHHGLEGFKELWFNRNYRILSKNAGGKILDIACGDGRLIDFLGRSETVDGFDISRRAIELARSKQAYRNLWQADIMEEYSYWRDSYDFFICSLSLQYLKEEQLANHFRFMRKVLSRGGEYRFSLPNTGETRSPRSLNVMLRPHFKHIIMQTITGFVPQAEKLNPEELKNVFNEVKDCDLEESCHYMVSVRVS